jgi:hypothetical protein
VGAKLFFLPRYSPDCKRSLTPTLHPVRTV